MKFNEEKHIYTNDEGKVYLSVTGFVKKFCKAFEREKRAKAFAKKNKRKVEDVLEEWDKAGQDAIAKGNMYHKMMESEILGEGTFKLDDIEYDVFPGEYDEVTGDKYQSSLILEPGVYPECIVWSDRYRIAGQADRIIITPDYKIDVTDYKTSKEIKLRSYQKWDGTYETMGFPFTHLEDCNFNQYCLQLNTYAFLVKSHNRNLDVGKMVVQHVIGDYDEGTFDIKQIVEYEVPNMQDDIKVGLEYYVNRMNNGN